MTEEELLDFEWLAPWRPLLPDDGDGRAAFERELEREVPPGHPLYATRLTAIGLREGQDDVLFLVHTDPPRLACVHLTWQVETDPKWPDTELYDSAAAWVERQMRPDHEGNAE